jgi:hypothetical protein
MVDISGHMAIVATVGFNLDIAPYGPWVDLGTGVFGPRHAPITSANPMVFRGSRGWRRTRTILGQMAQHFVDRGLAAIGVETDAILNRTADQVAFELR